MASKILLIVCKYYKDNPIHELNYNLTLQSFTLNYITVKKKKKKKKEKRKEERKVENCIFINICSLN